MERGCRYYLSNGQKRDRTFDLLKLYAMLSVVLDHALEHMIGGTIQYTQLYNWIFLSQMPIFMFASGYFASSGIYKKLSICDYLKKLGKTVTSLFIPFVSFAIIVSILNGDNIVFKSILHPEYSLWFLWTLLWMQIIMLTAQQVTKCFVKAEWLIIFVSIGFYFIGLVPVGVLYIKLPTLFQSKLIIFYSIFYLFGYFYSFMERNIIILKNDKFRVVCISVMFVVVAFVMITHPTVMYDSETIINIAFRFIGSFAATLLMLYVMSFVVRIKWCETIAAFGVLSLEMYYIHLLFIRLPFFNSVGASPIIFVAKYLLLVCISIVTILTLKRHWIPDLIFFGKLPAKK